MHTGDMAWQIGMLDGYHFYSVRLSALCIWIYAHPEAGAWIISARSRDIGIWMIPICIPDDLIVVDT
jgi:hypothetical protein